MSSTHYRHKTNAEKFLQNYISPDDFLIELSDGKLTPHT